MSVHKVGFFVLFLSLLSGFKTKPLKEELEDVLDKKLSRVNSMSDFRRIFNIGYPERDVRKYSTLKHLNDTTKKIEFATTTPLPCIPRLTSITIDTTGGFRYYPPCVSTNICGGCCAQQAVRFTCKANVTARKTEYVYKIYPDGVTAKKVTFSYDSHDSCKCDCKRTSAECVGKQTFDKDTCICKCDVSETCPKLKRWSNIACDCVCNDQSCPSGSVLDKKTCECKFEDIVTVDDGCFDLIDCPL